MAPPRTPGSASSRASLAGFSSAGSLAEQSRLRVYWLLIRSSPWYHQLFIVLVLLQCAYLVVERAVLFSYVNLGNAQELRDSCYFLGIILISVAFSGYYGIHSVLSVNYMELAAFRVLTLWLLVRLIVEYVGNSVSGIAECRDTRGSVTCLGFLAVGAVFNVATIVLTFFMLNDLRWKRYKAIGAEVDTQVMYRRFELFSAVRKVDLQFSLVTLYTGLVYCSFNFADTTAQYTLGANVALIVVEGFWEWLGDTAVKTENENRMYAFWALSVFLPSFIVNVAIDAFTDNSILRLVTSPAVRITIGVFGLLALINRAITVACSVLLYRAFGGPRYAGLRRIFEGGRMGKFSRGRLTAASLGPGGGGGGSGGAAAAASSRNLTAAAAGGSGPRVGGTAPPLVVTANPAAGVGGGDAGAGVELEMGDIGVSGNADPWSRSAASSSSSSSTSASAGAASGRGGMGMEDYASSTGGGAVAEWGSPTPPRSAGRGTVTRSASGGGAPTPQRLLRVGSAGPGGGGGPASPAPGNPFR